MNSSPPAYGLWLLALINAAVFIAFAFSFTKPRTARDWRSFGMFAAFIVALFTEMYGFPLTIYVPGSAQFWMAAMFGAGFVIAIVLAVYLAFSILWGRHE